MRGTTPVGVAVPAGRHHDHRIADVRVQLVRQRAAEDDAVGAGSQLLEAAGDHVLRQAGSGALLGGQHAAHLRPGEHLAAGEHRLAVDVRHRREHARLAAHLLLQLLPVT